MIMNQFENLVINHNNTEEKTKTSEKIYTGFEYLISTDLVTKLEENQMNYLYCHQILYF